MKHKHQPSGFLPSLEMLKRVYRVSFPRTCPCPIADAITATSQGHRNKDLMLATATTHTHSHKRYKQSSRCVKRGQVRSKINNTLKNKKIKKKRDSQNNEASLGEGWLNLQKPVVLVRIFPLTRCHSVFGMTNLRYITRGKQNPWPIHFPKSRGHSSGGAPLKWWLFTASRHVVPEAVPLSCGIRNIPT